MKFCPACNTQYADHLSFCQKDGTRLADFDPNAATTPYLPTVAATPPPPTFTAPATQPVARAVPLNQPPPPVLETQPIGAVTQPNRNPVPPTMPQAPLPPTVDYSTNRAQAKRNNWLPWVVVFGFAFLVAAGAGIYWFFATGVQRSYEAALKQGQLITPSGTSAYDVYQQLKRDGVNTEKLNALAKPYLNQLVTQPQQMLSDLAQPGKREAAPEEAQNAWDQAQRALAWATEIEPKNNKLLAQASYAAGRAAFLRNDKDKALELWKKAADQDKTWFLPLNSMSVIYNERKNYPAARKVCEEAIRREANSALPYNNLGTAWLLAKDDIKAAENYRKAIELAPNWPRPHAWLAEIAMRRKDYKLAVEEFEMVLSLDVTTETSLDMNKIRKALEDARKLLEQAELQSPAPVSTIP
jgi:tetratricopeptide (TPR) repeat protein